MKKFVLQKPLASILFGLSAIAAPLTLTAAVATDACSKELLLTYFPENFVRETLRKFNVPQDKWDAIVKGLNAKDKDVVREVEDKSSKLTPNPLKDRSPEQRQVAVKIFRESLLDVFGSVLKANGITDDKQIQSMLSDIQQQKARNFAQCMEKQKEQFEKERSEQGRQETIPSKTPDNSSDQSPSSSDTDEQSKDQSTSSSEDHLSEADDSDNSINQDPNPDGDANDNSSSEGSTDENSDKNKEEDNGKD